MRALLTVVVWLCSFQFDWQLVGYLTLQSRDCGRLPPVFFWNVPCS